MVRVTLGQKLRLARGKTTQTDMAAKVGIDRSRYSRIENDRCEPRPDELARIAKAAGCSVDSILWVFNFEKPFDHPQGHSDGQPSPAHRCNREIRVAGEVAADGSEGRLILDGDHHDETVQIPDNCLCLTVRDVSMEPVALDGQKILVTPAELTEIQDGDLVVVVLTDGRRLFKRAFSVGQTSFDLVSENTRFRPIRVQRDEIEQLFLFWGALTGGRRRSPTVKR